MERYQLVDESDTLEFFIHLFDDGEKVQSSITNSPVAPNVDENVVDDEAEL
jgi:hypothetical protein